MTIRPYVDILVSLYINTLIPRYIYIMILFYMRLICFVKESVGVDFVKEQLVAYWLMLFVKAANVHVFHGGAKAN